MIALRRDYLELAKFGLTQWRPEEALRCAAEGLGHFQAVSSLDALVLLIADLLAATGREREVREHLWQAFERCPSLALYARLRPYGDVVRERALEILATRSDTPGHGQRNDLVDVFVGVLTIETMFDGAWSIARHYQASLDRREALAWACEATHPREAVGVYAERVSKLLEGGGDRTYAAAARLVAHMGTLRDPVEQKAYVDSLKVEFGRKRNIMKLLA